MNRKNGKSLFARLLKWTVVLLLLAAAGYGLWYKSQPQPVEVVVKPVTRGLVERTVSNTRAGTVKACRRAKLSPNMGGQVTTLTVKKGDRVKEGDLLIELWNKDLAAQIVLSEREVKVSRSRLDSATSRAEIVRRNADRLVKLLKSKVVAQESVDNVVAEADALRSETESARLQIQSSEARLALAKATYEKTRLLAPFDGVIAEINTELHEYVTPSPVGIPTPPVIEIITGGCYYVIAPIDEVDVADVRRGMPARVTMDAFRGRVFTGRVRRIADYVLEVEKQARTVEVEVEFDRPGEALNLLAGYSADIEIVLEERRDVVRAPAEAVVEGKKVYVFHPETGRIESRAVEAGLSNWDRVEVSRGLAPDELVVVNVDKPDLKDGALAVILKETP
ncbi:MAG: efflux RND transporter periplasmic adaptor subunit [Pseudomonadota bacterium]